MTDAEVDKQRLRNLRRRVLTARRNAPYSDPYSRHLHIMADGLLSGGYPMLTEEPEHCAISILAVLESLWTTRTELARLKAREAA